MKNHTVWKILFKSVPIFIAVLLFSSFTFTNVYAYPTGKITYSLTTAQPKMQPYVPGCLPWLVSERTNGNFVVDLEEDNCGGYYTIAYFTNLSVANFHVYISAGANQDGYCHASLGYTSCLTPYVGYSGNSNHQVCFYGEGGASAYTNSASGCIRV